MKKSSKAFDSNYILFCQSELCLSCWHCSFLKQAALEEILRRDSFYAPEILIFRALQHWRDKNPEAGQFSQVFKHVRLPLMTLDELLNIVRPSSLVSADSILDAIQVKNHSRDMQLSYRGVLRKFDYLAQGNLNWFLENSKVFIAHGGAKINSMSSPYEFASITYHLMSLPPYLI